MAIDYTLFAIAKGTPRVVDRIQKKLEMEQQERDCRRAVKARDQGKCVVPGCAKRSQHLHHIVYRSRGGRWLSQNVCSLCVGCHELVHLGKIHILGNADQRLTITVTSRTVHGVRL